MSAGADSIRPFAVDFAPEMEAAARAVAELRDSLFPRAPEIVRDQDPAPEIASQPLAISAPLFTAIAFRPDGRRALAIELTLLRCVAFAVGTAATLGAAIGLGWMIGEWTARL